MLHLENRFKGNPLLGQGKSSAGSNSFSTHLEEMT
jgi:hypothetical protein